MVSLLLELILMVAGIFLVVAGGFCAACCCVGLLTDCDMDKAAEKVREFLDSLWDFGKTLWTDYKDKKANNNPALETTLIAKSCADIRLLIGAERYQQHCAIAVSGIDQQLIFTRVGDDFNLSYIGNSVYYADDNEKCRLESKLIYTTKACLRMYGYDTRVLTEWQKRPDLDMPVLFIYYAKTSKQKKILDDELKRRGQAIVTRNTAVVDDTEEVDLF